MEASHQIAVKERVKNKKVWLLSKNGNVAANMYDLGVGNEKWDKQTYADVVKGYDVFQSTLKKVSFRDAHKLDLSWVDTVATITST